LDGIREEIITDISLAIGGDYNIFDIVPNIVKPKSNPVISNEDLDKIRNIDRIPSVGHHQLYEIKKGVNGLERALEKGKLPTKLQKAAIL
jgi:glutamate synthase (ferredoxin)